MNQALVKLIEEAINAQRAETFLSSQSDDIYEDRLGQVQGFEYIPQCIYFTYVGFNASTMKVNVEHYFYPGGDPLGTGSWAQIPLPPNNGPSLLKDKITELAQNAAGPKNNPSPYAFNFQELKWRRKSYMVFVFDDIIWKIHKFRNNQEAVVFYDSKFRTEYTPNHSFYDGIDYDDIEITKNGVTLPREAVAFINHMKKADGTDLLTAEDSEQYQFGIYFDVEFTSGSGGVVTFIVDPGGTNQGPPIDP